MKLLFKAATFYRTIADKYRASYYAYVYGSQLSIAHSVTFGDNTSVSISPGAKLARLVIGENTRFRKFCSITLDASGKLEIGQNTFFNNNCSLNCLDNIKIGDNTLFGEGVRIYDHNHVFNKKDLLIEKQGFSTANICIGNNCWIGSNVIILKGVTIGDNAVIGSGCVITASVPANTLVKTGRETIESSIVFKY